MKNVIILEDSSKATFGGGQKVTLEVMRILNECYNIFLFDHSDNSKFFKKADPYIIAKKKLFCYGKIKNSTIKSSFNLEFSEIIAFPVLIFLNFLQFIYMTYKLQLHPDNSIIYATSKKGLLLAYIANKFLKFNYIYHAHSVDNKTSFFYKIIYPALVCAKKIICVSEVVKKNIKLSNCTTVYNPVSQQPAMPPKQLNKIVVVATFSSLIKCKGIKFFMESFKYLKNKKHTLYWVFGEGEEKEHLKQYVNSSVELKGFSENSAQMMKKHIDIIVVPSIISEACPMVPIEAFSFGIPVITTKIGGQAEIVRDNFSGFHLPIENSQVIAEKIDNLIENPQLFHTISKNAIKHANKFCIKTFTETILNIFNSQN